MKWHTKYRPGDLVKDRKTGDEGVIIRADAVWRNKDNMAVHRSGDERKRPSETYRHGHYGIYPKTHYGPSGGQWAGSLNGSWYDDDEIELVKKGFLHNAT